MRVVVIGGGAAGYFAAIAAKESVPASEVVLLEKTRRPLAKVRVSGGGRCNVTHACMNIRKLAAHYPRGERFLRKAFEQWGVKDTVAWFEDRGVRLKTEADGRMFPVTDDSGTIIAALDAAVRAVGVDLRLGAGVDRIERMGEHFILSVGRGEVLEADRAIVTSGGHPKRDGYAWFARLGQPIIDPVPSLFTFNLVRPLADLMGTVAPTAIVRLEGTAHRATGALLITHWGFSGPAVLRLSAWAARDLHALGYRYAVRVNWAGALEDEVRAMLNDQWSASPRKSAGNATIADLPSRIWLFLLERAGIASSKVCGDIGKHDRNRLIDLLVNDRHVASGKTTFKEEFVTAGGVDLAGVDPRTMESLHVPHLYFAGEVLDIDGITGGFNFQAAWTTGRIAGINAARSFGAPSPALAG